MNISVVIVVLAAMPLMVFAAGRKLLSRKLGNASVAFISAALMYALILASVLFLEYRLENNLASFDTDGDGIFSGREQSLDQQEAMNKVVEDAGRTLAPFTAAVFSITYLLVVWLILSAVGFQKRRSGSEQT